jgi:hypothetical protein
MTAVVAKADPCQVITLACTLRALLLIYLPWQPKGVLTFDVALNNSFVKKYGQFADIYYGNLLVDDPRITIPVRFSYMPARQMIDETKPEKSCNKSHQGQSQER